VKVKQIIRKACKPNVFALFWTADQGEVVPDSHIVLDFNPIISHLKEENLLDMDDPFCLVHYQARPRGLRQYGIWYSGEYQAFRECVRSEVPSFCVCLEERFLQLPPNAVIVYPRSYFDPDHLAIRSINP
jgi:hypothetical protein